jgi:hypothetical protein
MSDELDRLREYVDSLPPPPPATLQAGRAELHGAMGLDVVPTPEHQGHVRWNRWPGRSRDTGPRRSSVVLVVGGAALLIAAVLWGLVSGGPAPSGHRTSTGRTTPKLLVRLVADDVNVTVASGSYDMTFNDTTVPPPNCAQSVSGTGAQLGPGATPSGCPRDFLPDISGHGTVDTNPYAMVAVSNDGPLGTITLYDNGTDVWEIGGGDYGVAGPGQAGPGAPLSGYATSVEGTVGEQAGALDMQGLASGTGYLDLEATEIQGAQPAGTGTVSGVPVTIYKVSVTGLQDPDLNGLGAEQVKTIRAADAILQETGFPGKTTWISVDSDGYIREERTTYKLSDGSSVTQDTVLSNFGCAGTVRMPGESGSSAPPTGCVSPDTAGQASASASAPTTTTPSSSPTTVPPTSSTTSPSRTTVPTPPAPGGGTVFLLGNGIGGVSFGKSENSVTAGLTSLLGSGPIGSTSEQPNCTVDLAEQWPNVTAYFAAGKFVGFSTLGANGDALPDGTLVTAQGLRVGDTLAEAQALYGPAFTTSFAQGGSWSVTTPTGTLLGYLNEEPDQTNGPPTIRSIEAGMVGCPAETP